MTDSVWEIDDALDAIEVFVEDFLKNKYNFEISIAFLYLCMKGRY